MAFAVAACSSETSANREDRRTGLTVSGPRDAVDRFLNKAEAAPHRWQLERRWVQPGGSHAVRLRWKTRSDYRQMAEVVAIGQVATVEGVAISDTEMIQIQR
jgi:hypothetical protein